MGEAKRRKALDPEYGKIPKTQKCLNQETLQILPEKPDYGCWWYSKYGMAVQTISAVGLIAHKSEFEDYIHFAAGDFLATIICEKGFVEAVFPIDSPLTIVPSPEEKFSPDLGSRVIPFRLTAECIGNLYFDAGEMEI